MPTSGIGDRGRRRDHQHVGAAAAAWRARHVGFIFQMYNLIPVLTAFQNVELPLLLTKLGAGRAPAARRDGARPGRARRPHEPLPAPALRRPGAARRHRARDRGRPDLPALRRADRRPRPQERRRDPGPARARCPGSTARRSSMVTHDPRAAERAHVVLHLDKGVLVHDPATEPRREVPAPDPAQPQAQEDADHPDDRLVRGRALPLRPAGDDRLRRSRPASRWPAPTAWWSSTGSRSSCRCRCPTRSGCARSRTSARSPTPPGSAASTRTDATSSPSSRSTPRPTAKVFPEFSIPDEQWQAFLADREGAIVRTRHGRALRLEGRRPHPDPGADLGRHLGVQPARHLRRDPPGRRHQRVLVPLASTSTSAASTARAWSAGTPSGSTTPRTPSRSPPPPTSASPTRPSRPRPRPRRPSPPASPTRWATSTC